MKFTIRKVKVLFFPNPEKFGPDNIIPDKFLPFRIRNKASRLHWFEICFDTLLTDSKHQIQKSKPKEKS